MQDEKIIAARSVRRPRIKIACVNSAMFHEDLRYIHEDVERLEQAIADRILEDPKQVSSEPTDQAPRISKAHSSQFTDPQ